jgi:hypothetical protein
MSLKSFIHNRFHIYPVLDTKRCRSGGTISPPLSISYLLLNHLPVKILPERVISLPDTVPKLVVRSEKVCFQMYQIGESFA